MPKRLHIPETPADTPSSTPHRSQYQVTIDRLCAMSPKELVTLGQKLAEHEAGDFVMKMLASGYRVKQHTLPGAQ